jgi:outer membrane protein OmpA-like peptidoglycan-associated protein
MALLATAFLLGSGAPAAYAAPVTVTYSANSSQHQTGYVAGTVPTTGSYNSGDLVTVASNSGTLARAGFTFLGWNTAADGSGTTYTAGSGTFTISTSLTLYANWQIPAAARLIGSSGSMVNLSNANNVANGSNCSTSQIRGIASDGTYLYFRSTVENSTLCQITMDGVVFAARSITGLNSVTLDSRALAFGSGCIFVRPAANTTSLSCIDMSTWTLHSLSLPGSYPFILGQGWLNGNLINFPDGRIGAVSNHNQSLPTGTGAGQCPSGMYCKVLRLYTLSGSGSGVTLTFSEDIVLADNQTGWPNDDHGISTDGTYLYQIQYNQGYKVWALASGSPSYLVFNGDGTGSCGASTGVSGTRCAINSPITGSDGSFSNATYLGRNHVTGEYIMGDYSASRFYKSGAGTPPPGPGNPAPAFGSISPTSALSTGGETVTITGTGFTTATSVTIGGVTATIVSKTGTSIVITIPATTPGVKDVVINASTGTATGTNAFTVNGLYSITVTQGSNGTISPGTATYLSGANQTFTFTPATGYSVETITIDSSPLSALTTPTLASAVASGYTFSNISSAHTISVSYKRLSFALSYSASIGGSISGSASQIVNYGESGTSVSALPATGYHFLKWSDSSTVATRLDTSTVENRSLLASFELDTNTVTYFGNGSTSGSVPVDTFTPYTYGSTVSVLDNSGTLGKTSFTFMGWNTVADGSGTSYAPGSIFTMPATPVGLYAQWTQNSLASIPSGDLTLLATFSIRSGIGVSGSFNTVSSSGSVMIPIDALPDGTTAKLYALGDVSSLNNLLPNGKTYFLSFVLSWLSATGTVPDISGPTPITMVISNSQIQVGTVVYGVSGGQLTTLATATQAGTVTVPITSDPALIIGNPIIQSPPPSTTSATIQSPRQVDTISSISPSKGSISGGTVVVISGSFEENVCKIINVSIDGVLLPLSSWNVTSAFLTVTMPAHGAGVVSINLYNGCTPVLDSLSFNYEITPMVTPPSEATPTPRPTPEVPTPAPPVIFPTTEKGPLEERLTSKVYFDMGSFQIKGKNLLTLNDLAMKIAGLGKAITITITGYAQPTPRGASLDLALSKNRAAAVAKYLAAKGVTTRVSYLGAGRAAVNAPSSRYVEIVASNS